MMEKLCDMVMKGPPRWMKLSILAAIILVVGVQVGMYKERSTQTAEAIKTQLDEKDAVINRLLIALNDAQFDLEIERTKLAIIECESGIKHEGVWGDGGRSYGIAQFQYRTFDWMRGQAGRPELRWKNRRDQLWLLDWALRRGYGKYWTCYSKTKAQRKPRGGEGA